MKISVDIEADGPMPYPYSMISLGAVVVDEALDKQFYMTLAPISASYVQEALAVSGFTRAECLAFPDPLDAMEAFATWVAAVNDSTRRPLFVSDNAGFDWQFVNWYFHTYTGSNPFGFSSLSLTSLYKGVVRDMTKNFRHLRSTKHTHNALDDAIGNAQAILEIRDMGVKGL